VTQQNTKSAEDVAEVARRLANEATDLVGIVESDAAVFIRWDASLSVKGLEMDNQHKKLVDYINSIHAKVMRGANAGSILPLLKELAEYAVYHFRCEEELVAKYGFPDLEKHRPLHEALLRDVKKHLGDLSSGRNVDLGELMSFLKNWLLVHIKNSDMKYGVWLNEKGVR
jgi:hemerythrin-like metal-binding protein